MRTPTRSTRYFAYAVICRSTRYFIYAVICGVAGCIATGVCIAVLARESPAWAGLYAAGTLFYTLSFFMYLWRRRP